MMNMLDVQNVMSEIHKEQAEYGEFPQPPASPSDISNLSMQSVNKLGVIPPKEYFDFLLIEDGLNFNGFFLYGTKTQKLACSPKNVIEGLIEANLLWRNNPDLRDYLIFGEGNQDLYTMHIPSKEYIIMDRVPGNIEFRFVSFFDLLHKAISTHL